MLKGVLFFYLSCIHASCLGIYEGLVWCSVYILAVYPFPGICSLYVIFQFILTYLAGLKVLCS